MSAQGGGRVARVSGAGTRRAGRVVNSGRLVRGFEGAGMRRLLLGLGDSERRRGAEFAW